MERKRKEDKVRKAEGIVKAPRNVPFAVTPRSRGAVKRYRGVSLPARDGHDGVLAAITGKPRKSVGILVMNVYALPMFARATLRTKNASVRVKEEEEGGGKGESIEILSDV